MLKEYISIDEWYRLPPNEKEQYYYVSDELGTYFAYKTEEYRKATGDGYSDPEIKDDYDELIGKGVQ
ncbi:hypothetical protein [Enterococcus sp. DIV0240a]|uniref:hypothetical protein n=1 Tax=Enterococcus sp. DIV0240a TaxID=2774651 RepID=UPI003D27E827